MRRNENPIDHANYKKRTRMILTRNYSQLNAYRKNYSLSTINTEIFRNAEFKPTMSVDAIGKLFVTYVVLRIAKRYYDESDKWTDERV